MKPRTAWQHRSLVATLALAITRAVPGGGFGELVAQRPNDAAVVDREIRATEIARFQAMTHADLGALDSLLGADLTYTHTDGERQNKAAFEADLRSGALVYLAAEPESVVVRAYGTTAVVDGRAHMRVRADGKDIAFTIRFLEAYVRRRGRWELVAWQSTRLDVPARL